jgi:hypothetical protein
MMPVPSRGAATGADGDPMVALLLFEVADCLMALPAAEVVRLAPERRSIAADLVDLSGERIDLSERFTGCRSEGPWLCWERQGRQAWLRVGRVVEVLSCPIGALAPMPALLGAGRSSGPFWAAGVHGGDVFLLMDPARLQSSDEPRA